MASSRKPLRDRIRERLARPHTCSCGWHGKTYRAMNAHHLARHGGYWGSKAGRAAGRKIGKAQDAARRHARGWREAHGLIDRYGASTAKGRSRPELRGRLTRRQLRQAHRHDRDHERAGRHERKAEQARARGNPAREADRHHRAANLRNQWPERVPARTAPFTAPRTSPADGNGDRPGRTARTRRSRD